MKQILNYSPIKGFNSFKKAYSLSKKYRYDNFTIAICPRNVDLLIKGKNPSPNKIYCGISIPKKIFKKAVVRNRIKRLIKETLRQYIKINQNNPNLQAILVILVIWNGPIIQNPRQIKLNDVQLLITNALDQIVEKMESK